MERRTFIKSCCYATVGGLFLNVLLSSCGAIYYANHTMENNRLIVNRSEFWRIKKDKRIKREFVLLKSLDHDFPICLYEAPEDRFFASFLKCTHKGCELNVGGGIYSCPCHGSEFSMTGQVLEGPAERDLLTFKTEVHKDAIHVFLS